MARIKRNFVPLWRFLFVVYCGIMLWLLFGRSGGWNASLPYAQQLRQNTNLTPFFTIQNYLYVLQHPSDRYILIHCFINLAGNILLFIPAGWLFPHLWQRMQNFFRFLFSFAGIILLIETIQLFSLLGRFDVDDVILNLVGATFGFIMHAICYCKH